MHPKAKSSTDFEAADNKEEQAVPYGFLRGRTTINVHRNRGGQQLCFLRVLACISRLSYNI
jgi:hypothetical protein